MGVPELRIQQRGEPHIEGRNHMRIQVTSVNLGELLNFIADTLEEKVGYDKIKPDLEKAAAKVVELAKTAGAHDNCHGCKLYGPYCPGQKTADYMAEHPNSEGLLGILAIRLLGDHLVKCDEQAVIKEANKTAHDAAKENVPTPNE
jgi:hypothetical protein